MSKPLAASTPASATRTGTLPTVPAPPLSPTSPTSPSRRLFESLRLDTRDASPGTGPSTGSGDSSHSGRGRGSSVQNRRMAGALGLGVTFANGTATSDGDTLSKDRSVSRSHSRRNSDGFAGNFFNPPPSSNATFSPSTSTNGNGFGGSTVTPPELMTYTTVNGHTTTSAVRPTRRPSLSHLASFLSGIEHHTRVRTGGVAGGRGVSRSASRSTSRTGERRGSFDGERILLDGDDYYDDEPEEESELGDPTDDESYHGQTGQQMGTRNNRRRSVSFGSRTSSIASVSRRGSITFPSILVPNHPGNHHLSDESDRNKLWEDKEWGDGDSVASLDTYGTLTQATSKFPTASANQSTPTASASTAQTARHVFQPPSTPRVLPTYTNEEPYLETAPSSPNPLSPQHDRRYSSHFDLLAPSSNLEDVEIFDEGERIGVGVYLEDRGGWVRDCFGDEEEGLEIGIGGGGEGIEGAPTEMEVLRRLGEGTYAIVYLVREVLSASVEEDDLVDPLSPSVDSNPSPSAWPTRPLFHSWASDPFETAPPTVYGRSFALKCLCKKDLSDDLIEIQRGEAVLHRALPEHEFIVRLYAAYETDDWLFLVLEYCPGQDLFYWLDERQDSSMALFDDFHSRATSPFQPPLPLPISPSSPRLNSATPLGRPPTIDFGLGGGKSANDEEELMSKTLTQVSTGAALMSSNNRRDISGESDQTPPSPSLLSWTADTALLSRKRLRLISRMFGQMCSAVEACHQAGVAHRDIKPENFIVMDGRGEGGADGERGKGRGRVVVKITDWGLGTREPQCEDFDCGSKPYMAYECRNNLQPTYDPRQADVWSLGLVLLNLLYHRNPWADPSLSDPDFSAYVSDPIGFLQDRFEGIGMQVARFLTDRVFCDILEMEGGKMRRRVTAGEFGEWSTKLVAMMGAGAHRASVSEHTFPLTSTISRPSPGSRSPLESSLNNSTGAGGSLLSQYAPINTSAMANGATVSPSGLSDTIDILDEIEEEDGKYFDAANSTLQPSVSLSMDTPIKKLLPPSLSVQHLRFNTDDDSLPSPSFPPSHPAPPPVDDIPVSPLRSFAASPTNIEPEPSPSSLAVPISIPLRRPSLDSSLAAIEADSPSPKVDLTTPPEEITAETTIQKAKRRKRGARKGKAARAAGELSPDPLSPASPLNAPTLEQQRDKVLSDLASASQDLAREVSRAKRSFGTQSTSALPSSTHSSSQAGIVNIINKPKPPGRGVFERMRNLVKDGNPDLQAFKQRADERNASSGTRDPTYSAPAQLQGNARGRMIGSGETSRSSMGVNSWGSYEGEESTSRGRGANPDSTPWSSASSRRERLEKQRRGPSADFAPVSTAKLAPTLGTESNAASAKDWRQPSPHSSTRSYPYTPPAARTHSAPPLPVVHDVETSSLPILAIVSKPRMREIATDTTDLGRPSSRPPVLAAPPKVVSPKALYESPVKRVVVVESRPPASLSPVSFIPVKASLSSRTAGSELAGGDRNTNTKPTKLGFSKLLHGMSVFNRNPDQRERENERSTTR